MTLTPEQEPNPWRDAVINELVTAHIYCVEHDSDPSKAIQDAITWNCQVALDPAVSSDARALIEPGRASTPAVGGERKLIGWRTSDYLMETADKKMADNWANHHDMLPIFDGDPHTKLAAPPAPAEPADVMSPNIDGACNCALYPNGETKPCKVCDSAPVVQGEAVASEARQLLEWFREAGGFKQGTAAPHKWVLQAESELRRLADMIDATPPAARTAEVNQCDGCQAGMPLSGHIHMADGRADMACQKERYTTPQAPTQGVQVTDEMVTTYLTANDTYWRCTDEIPTPPGKWRTGNPREATRVSLEAVFAARAAQAQGSASKEPPNG